MERIYKKKIQCVKKKSIYTTPGETMKIYLLLAALFISCSACQTTNQSTPTDNQQYYDDRYDHRGYHRGYERGRDILPRRGY